MRHFLFSTTALIALSMSGPAAAQMQQQGTPPSAQEQQPGNPPPAQEQARPQDQKPAPSTTPEQQKGVNDYLTSPSGRGGKQEPSASANNDAKEDPNAPVLVNGALNVPGAPKDSQTVPAKFSARNEAMDKTPILAMPELTNDQKQKIAAAIRASKAPVEKVDAKVSTTLPNTVPLIDLPPTLRAEMPGAKDLKFVRLEDRVLVVYAPNWLVVGEIK